MTPVIDTATLAINDYELHQLLDEAAEYCRRVGRTEVDRRSRKRYAFGGELTLFRVQEDGVTAGNPIAGQARDISLWGISLFTVGEFSRHDRLVVELTVPRRTGQIRSVRLLVEVRHVKLEPTGGSTLGCALLETVDSDSQ